MGSDPKVTQKLPQYTEPEVLCWEALGCVSPDFPSPHGSKKSPNCESWHHDEPCHVQEELWHGPLNAQVHEKISRHGSILVKCIVSPESVECSESEQQSETCHKPLVDRLSAGTESFPFKLDINDWIQQ
jgi:hypothetical protein